jgi:hypothetical protein
MDARTSRRLPLAIGFAAGALWLIGPGTGSAFAAAPVCSDNSYSLDNTQSLPLPITANCHDDDGDTMTGFLNSNVSHGFLQPDGAGGAIYHPNSGYVGPDSFSFHANANGEDSNVVTISITVTGAPGGAAPACFTYAQGLQAFEGRNTTFGVPCMDPDTPPNALSVTDVTQGSHGVATFDGLSGTYAAEDEYIGPDTFSYRVSDGSHQSAPVTVSVDVVDFPEGNQPPTCPDTAVFVEQDSSILLTGNCVDPDNDPIFYGPGNPFTVNGTFTDPTGNSVVFHPTPGYTGPAELNYTVRDPYHDNVQFHIPIDVLPIGTPCCESAPEATPEEPYAASVTSPVPGGIYIDTRPTSVPAPTGFTVLGQEYDMHAPDAVDVADPLVFVFKIDGAELASAGVNPDDVKMIRDGVPIHDTCPAPGDRSGDDWWPCEESRTDHDGDLWVTVLTMKASVWNVGVAEAADADDDGVADEDDNCPAVSNPSQLDADQDEVGAACDTQEVPTSRGDCKDGGWKAFDGIYKFKNQGDCVSNVASGARNKPNGRRKHKPRHHR